MCTGGRVEEHTVNWALLDNPARVDDENAIGQDASHSEVVRDEQDRHIRFFAQPAKKLKNLGLYGHVERARRFVRDEERGLQPIAIAIITRWLMPPLN